MKMTYKQMNMRMPFLQKKKQKALYYARNKTIRINQGRRK